MNQSKPTSSKESEVYLDDILTNAFGDQLKLVEKSLSMKKDKKDKTDKPQVSKEKVHIFNNRSRKYRFEENIDTPSQKTESINEPPKNQNINKEIIMPPPVDADSLPLIEDKDQAHASMLMSWYMAGYHTGYYKAMTEFKN